jgi:predicted porin
LLHNGTAGHTSNGQLGANQGLASSGAGTQRAAFSRRQVNTVNFHSNDYAGFRVLAAFSAADESTALTSSAAPTSKPRLYAMGATYTAGPLYLGVAYDEHKSYNPGNQTFGLGAGQYQEGKDHAWEVVAAFTIGPVRLGASYHDKKYEVAAPATGPLAGGPGATRDLKHKAWALYADWRIVGPHSLRLGYIHANDVKGDATVSVNSLAAPRVAATGASVGDTGGQLYLIQYAYHFSKRTEVNFGYSYLDNDPNSFLSLQSPATRNTCQGVAGAGQVPPAVASCDRKQSAIVLGVIHRF